MTFEKKRIENPVVLLSDPDGDKLRKIVEEMARNEQIVSYEYQGEGADGHSYKLTMVAPVEYISMTQVLKREP
jgi:hypothetical protein